MKFTKKGIKKAIAEKQKSNEPAQEEQQKKGEKSSLLKFTLDYFFPKKKKEKAKVEKEEKTKPKLRTKLLKGIFYFFLIIVLFGAFWGFINAGEGSVVDKEEEEPESVVGSEGGFFEITKNDRIKIKEIEEERSQIVPEDFSEIDVNRGDVVPAHIREEEAYVVENGKKKNKVEGQKEKENGEVSSSQISLFPESSPNIRGNSQNQTNKAEDPILKAIEEAQKKRLKDNVTTEEDDNKQLQGMGVDYSYLLDMKVNVPLSPYQIMQGTFIPIIMITGINSDLPGMIKARVLSDVYNTVDGKYLIIPAGSQVIGNYNSSVAFGQKRLMVAWERLIRPDGTSVNLKQMNGVDFSGYSGYSDKVDFHYGELSALLIFSTLLNLTSGQISYLTKGDRANDNAKGVGTRSAGDSAQNITSAINSMADKFLNVSPTITIRAGMRANIMVNKDFILSPYGKRIER